MAQFTFHGHPDVIDELNEELPNDGTAWDQYLLEAVRLRNEAAGPGKAKEIRKLDKWDELVEELPQGDVDPVEYLIECVRMRKKVEARELVLTSPDN